MACDNSAGRDWTGPERRRGDRAQWTGPERRRHRIASTLEPLEPRVHLHADPQSRLDWNDSVVTNADAVSLTLLANAQAGSAKLPLSSMPSLSSDPGATATIYLDFAGAPAMTWLAYNVPATPAYDQDGDPTTFTSAELTSINEIWAGVAEEYSPFNINVTTVAPSSLIHGKNMELVIGGSGSWLGAAAGGISYIGSFTSSFLPNISFVFPAELANGTPKYTADATAHEAGHELGLYHQATWSGTTLVADYSTGTPADGPVMGDPYGDTRATWRDGTSDVSSTTIQDDLAVITNGTNAFGYRDDGISHLLTSPTSLTGTSLSDTGIISTTSQVDYYQFTTGAGNISLATNQFSIPGAFNGMLSLKFSLYNSSDQLVASSGSGLTESLNSAVTAGTYIVAVSSDGTYGDIGQYTFSGTVIAPQPTTPTSLGAVAASTSQINLSWTDTAGDETGFYIERSPDNSTWTQIASTTSTTYQDTGLSSATTYYYRIRAYNSGGNSGYTSVASVATLTPVPNAPTSLLATANSTSAIGLSWTDNSNNESGFHIERSPDNSTWTQITSTAANSTIYTDAGLSSSTIYYYRVRAYNTGGNSAYTNVSSATTPTPIPATPSSLIATPISASEIDLSWTDNSNQTGFYVERSPDNSTWTQIGSTASTSYQDTGLSSATTYYYRVRAYNAGGNSNYATATPATTLAPVPAAPSNLLATSVNTAEIVLTWTNNTNNAAGIYIECSSDNETWTQITSLSPTATTYDDTDLTVGATYFYRIRAYTNGGNSNYSNTSSAVAFPLIAPPIPAQSVAAAPTAFNQVTLSWIPSPGDTGFYVQRSSDRNTWNTIAQLPQSATSYQDTSADAGTHYFYRVIAYNGAGNAPASNLASATTPGYSVILDNANSDDVTVAGPWSRSTSLAGYSGTNFLQDNNLNKGQSSVTFAPTLPESGVYQVSLRWTSAPNRADNVPITVNYDGGSVQLEVNQRQNGGRWVLLGMFNFTAGSTGLVTISNANTDGIVVADAVQFVKVPNLPLATYRVPTNVIVVSPLPAADVQTDLSILG